MQETQCENCTKLQKYEEKIRAQEQLINKQRILIKSLKEPSWCCICGVSIHRKAKNKKYCKICLQILDTYEPVAKINKTEPSSFEPIEDNDGFMKEGTEQ